MPPKQTGDVVYDAPDPDGTAGGGTSDIAAGMANAISPDAHLPPELRVPVRVCTTADCPAGETAGGSTGRVDRGLCSQ
jgi:hypothetical protein